MASAQNSRDGAAGGDVCRAQPSGMSAPGLARLVNGSIVFDEIHGLNRAIQYGCFFLRIPAHIDTGPGVEFCKQFYLSSDLRDTGESASHGFRGYKSHADIYFDRENFQTEHVLIDRAGRERHFPLRLRALCDQMNEICISVMRHVLQLVGVPEMHWDRVTGGAACDRGNHWFAASHYRAEIPKLGCAPHKDTGFVTALYMEQPGLEAWIGDKWTPIDPLPGCFLINFGAAFELLTGNLPSPVKAVLHRVRQTYPSTFGGDRFSFAAFTNPPAQGDMFACDSHGSASPVISVDAFLEAFNKATWSDRHDTFGIK